METEEKQEPMNRLQEERKMLTEARTHLHSLKEARHAYVDEQGSCYEMLELSQSNFEYFSKKKERVLGKSYLKRIPLYTMLSLVPITVPSLMAEGVNLLAIGSSVCASVLIGGAYGMVKQVRGEKHLPTYIQGIKQAERNIASSEAELNRLRDLDKSAYVELKEVQKQVQEKEKILNTVEQDVRYDSSIPVFSSDEKPKVFYKQRS